MGSSCLSLSGRQRDCEIELLRAEESKLHEIGEWTQSRGLDVVPKSGAVMALLLER